MVLHALAGWALCAAVMGVGMAFLPPDRALLVHAAAAPVIFAAVAFVYMRQSATYAPLTTAIGFTLIVMAVDFFGVALAVLRSLAMFASVAGTWLPFAEIFLSTFVICRISGYRRS